MQIFLELTTPTILVVAVATVAALVIWRGGSFSLDWFARERRPDASETETGISLDVSRRTANEDDLDPHTLPRGP